ncbi:unnamed protein product, partial [Meganyctiphanes norvegica]
SGEELYTEGSSEDENSHHHQHGGHSHHHHLHHHHHHGHHSPSMISNQEAAPIISLQDKQSSDLKSKCSTTTEDAPNIASASEPAMQEQPHLTETTRRLSLMGIDETVTHEGAMGGEQHDLLEEQEEIMLWRPKRGSLKLPHIELDPPSPPRTDLESID